ncbi:MAG: tRNA (N6-threonylcarbamoyladenosine(37)-N6)-methyltransferase TrmO [Mariprofundaceae bacterium]|nr:tRNA (N6-threonylcarbamoyladenosine(37)-N6)-methyltransferase TrmO [Mariprofundaceae bacterium]
MKPQKKPKNYTGSFQETQAANTCIQMNPIGVVHSPFKERFTAPRQPDFAAATAGKITLHRGYNFEQALSDLGTFSHIWVLYWMHLNQGWNPTVMPPRGSDIRRGLFSTRAPHRPNSIGLSVVKLTTIKKRCLYIEGLDMLDGTPVLDIKPYLPYADAINDASHGWLDPNASFAFLSHELECSHVD